MEEINLDIAKVTTLVTDKLEGWLTAAIAMLPNFVIAVIVLVLFVLLAKVLRKLVRKVLMKISHNETLTSLFETIIYLAVIAVGTFVALSVLNLEKTVTTLLAGAGIIGLALGFAFQDIAANFVSGIMMATRKPFKIGDMLETNSHIGLVYKMNLRATILRTLQGQEVIIPNKDVFMNAIKNYTAFGERRVDLSCGISYGENLEKVRDVSLNAMKGLEFINTSKPVQFYYKEFGDSSINFDLRFWIKDTEQFKFFHAQSEAIIALKKAFDENDIMIPFPIRTLDFGIKGGEKLNENIQLDNVLNALQIDKSNTNKKENKP